MSSNSPANVDLGDPKLVSTFLGYVSFGLLIVFLVSILIDTFPFQPLSPAWIFSFSDRLVGTGVIALISFFLLHLAAVFNPGDHYLKNRLSLARQWGIAATIAFLLLIPYHSFGTWKFFTEAKQTQQTGLEAANRQFNPIRKAINEATSVADLQARLQQNNLGLRLNDEQLRQPITELKRTLIFEVDRAQNQIINRLDGPKPAQIWTAVQASFRIIASSLGYALAFAAGAQGKRASHTLLEGALNRWASLTGQRRRRLKQLVD